MTLLESKRETRMTYLSTAKYLKRLWHNVTATFLRLMKNSYKVFDKKTEFSFRVVARDVRK